MSQEAAEKANKLLTDEMNRHLASFNDRTSGYVHSTVISWRNQDRKDNWQAYMTDWKHRGTVTVIYSLGPGDKNLQTYLFSVPSKNWAGLHTSKWSKSLARRRCRAGHGWGRSLRRCERS